jgi:hypothetical protein
MAIDFMTGSPIDRADLSVIVDGGQCISLALAAPCLTKWLDAITSPVGANSSTDWG